MRNSLCDNLANKSMARGLGQTQNGVRRKKDEEK